MFWLGFTGPCRAGFKSWPLLLLLLFGFFYVKWRVLVHRVAFFRSKCNISQARSTNVVSYLQYDYRLRHVLWIRRIVPATQVVRPLFYRMYQWRNYGRQWRQPPQGASPEGAPRDQCQKIFLTPHRLTMQSRRHGFVAGWHWHKFWSRLAVTV